ncbi:hypothetical protein FRC03_006838 [Tulasnella sp. 419]|nr:hypothetical protein FRC02_009367 [Tulasnella sp. 418]KAG8960262.1 hypothetical protein FRC03_006838 [Tulasnella sp. 419]
MNSGHRTDVLNNAINHHNFVILIESAQNARRKLKLALKQQAESKDNFDALKAATPPSLVNEWEDVDITPRRNKQGILWSPYKMEESKVPTQKEIYALLTQSGTNSATDTAGSSTSIKVEFVDLGIKLEDLLTSFRKKSKKCLANEEEVLLSDTGTDTTSLRQTLLSDFYKWKRLARKVIPDLTDFEDPVSIDPDEVDIEDIALILPSNVPDLQRQEHAVLRDLVPIELSLRMGQAEDLLAQVRLRIKRHAWAEQLKPGNVRGQQQNTRAAINITALWTRITESQSSYNRVYGILQSLDPERKSTSRFHKLETKDLKADHALTSQLALGTGRDRLSWIWKVPKGMGISDEVWANEVDRVQYFRFQAQKDRWTEETEILQEEIKRLKRYFGFYADTWRKLIVRCPKTPADHGRNIYAHKMSTMYNRLRDQSNTLSPPHLPSQRGISNVALINIPSIKLNTDSPSSLVAR